MRPARVAALSALGMLLTGIAVYSFTPPGGASIAESPPPSARPEVTDAPSTATGSRFSADGTLAVDARLGHARLAEGGPGETYLMVELQASGGEARALAPVHLALAIDRSGSMRQGNRLRNALQAAITAVDRLQDGDLVTVVAFDTRTSVVVPPTVVDAASRARIRADIQGITLGGDTCISCAIEEAIVLLGPATDRVSRVLVLSDGEPTAGVRDVPGFRAIALRARDRGVSITTIGADVDYNEKILSAIAADSGGRHYFVENDADLARVFETEAESLKSSVAAGVEIAIELAPGVELVRVLDRSFRRAGSRVVVPIGALDARDARTALLKIRVPTGASRGGAEAVSGPAGPTPLPASAGPRVAPVARVEVTYRDLVHNAEGRAVGALAVELAGAAGDLDPAVEARVRRTATADALNEASALFQRGDSAGARRTLAAARQELLDAKQRLQANAPADQAAEIARDVDGQVRALQDAEDRFARPAAAGPEAPRSRAGKGALKQAEALSLPLRL